MFRITQFLNLKIENKKEIFFTVQKPYIKLCNV